MKKAKLKKLLHHQKQQAFLRKRQQVIEQGWNDLVKNGNQNQITLIPVPHKQVFNSDYVNQIRSQVINYLTNRKLSPPRSRITLSDYQVVKIFGIVSDFKMDTQQILIDLPTVFDSASPVDSHLWISLRRLVGSVKSAQYPLNGQIAIGDYIIFNATVKPYKARLRHQEYGYRWGLDKWLIEACGQVTLNKDPNSSFSIINQYNRGADWIVSFNHLKSYDELTPNSPVANQKQYRYQTSHYPTYQRRLIKE